MGSAAEHTGAKSRLILYSKPGCCLCDGLKACACYCAYAAFASVCLASYMRSPSLLTSLNKRQEKIEALMARAQFVPSALTDLELEVTFPLHLRELVCTWRTLPLRTQAPSNAAAPTYVCVG
jgi:hypothetical protein